MRIQEFCGIRMGYAFRNRLVNVPSGALKIIQPKDISSDGILNFQDNELLHTDVALSKPLQRDDVLVVIRGRFIAAVLNHPKASEYIVPASILILSITNKSVLPEYIALYINSPNGQKLFQRHM